MKTIEAREDVNDLVKKFYAKIRKDELLGPIFNGHIEEEQWGAHLEKLTDFWMTNLFGIACFKGNPTLKHLIVDKNLNHTVEQLHFGRWLQIWFETIDNNYEGKLANKAKEAARKMAHKQFMMIWDNKK